MFVADVERVYPSTKALVKEQIASRIFAQDASIYDFSEEAYLSAQEYMGWSNLDTYNQEILEDIKAFAQAQHAEGLQTVVLIGQGGSTQAPMTITKYNSLDSNKVQFKTFDSTSPVRVRSILNGCDPRKTLVIVSSKSGSTIEPRLALCALRQEWAGLIEEDEMPKRFVAITDPGSDLESQALREGWLAVFNGSPSIGGRFSALSVFGLLPAALVGIDIDVFLSHARSAQELCSQDSIDNPAINLAAFLFDNYSSGRNKFSFLTPKRGRVLGLWIEQLVAESLGKHNKGILPNIEIDSLLLHKDPQDRSVIMYQTRTDLWDERINFEMSLAYIDSNIPRLNYKIDSVYELAEHFVLWEYAIALCGYLMKVCPFDQPDVSSAKQEVLRILDEGVPDPDFSQEYLDGINMGDVEVYTSDHFKGLNDVKLCLKSLFKSIVPGDYFSLNAFLPFMGEGRREALEEMRHCVAEQQGVVSCLELGPRYLHSTGQLHKGGPNNGVFLILSADELKDIPLPYEARSMGSLSLAQAVGDCLVLSRKERRVVHLHLPDNSSVTLRRLAKLMHELLSEIKSEDSEQR